MLTHDSLVDLLKRSRANGWVEYPDEMQIYLRIGPRFIRYDDTTRDGVHQLYKVLDIANVTVYTPSNGLFTSWLRQLEDVAANYYGIQAIYIENVIEERFAKFFERQGYRRVPNRIDEMTRLWKLLDLHPPGTHLWNPPQVGRWDD